MNKLDAKARTQILHLLCEGQSIRAVTRILGVSKNTVSKLLSDAGSACAEYQDATLRGLTCKRVQCDEIWSFTYAKQKNVAEAKAAPGGAGDTWTWTALDSESKLIISWLVGGRDAEYAQAFMADVQSRLASRVQLTTDGHSAYLQAVEDAFGADVDYAMLVKQYGEPATRKDSPERRYSPAVCTGARKMSITGAPDPALVSTSHVERQNLTMRMHMRRFTRLTNAFSKKVEQHANAVSIHFMYYNFVRIHHTLRVAPAMAAGVSERLWEMRDIVRLIEEKESARPTEPRGPYKRRL